MLSIRTGVLSEIWRVLKRDGIVYAETPFMQMVRGCHATTRGSPTSAAVSVPPLRSVERARYRPGVTLPGRGATSSARSSIADAALAAMTAADDRLLAAVARPAVETSPAAYDVLGVFRRSQERRRN